MATASANTLSTRLKPLCSRDNHVMKYETAASRVNIGFFASYHCGSSGCSVRYNPNAGYYSLSGEKGHAFPVDEPGVNTLRCPVHKQWLYRGARGGEGVRWCCGVETCTYEYGSNQAIPT